MPTHEQMSELEIARVTLGLTDAQIYCDDYDLSPVTERNFKSSESKGKGFSGKHIGKITYNSETQEMSTKFFSPKHLFNGRRERDFHKYLVKRKSEGRHYLKK